MSTNASCEGRIVLNDKNAGILIKIKSILPSLFKAS